MSKKNLPTLVVSVEPLNFTNNKMDVPKKKTGKSRQSTPVPQESQAADNAESSSAPKITEAKPESSNAQEVVKTNGNTKPKSKREKRDSRSQTPAKDKPVTNGVTDVALNSNGTAHADRNLLVVDENPETTEDEVLVPNSEQDNDELFPELIYDETSDNECNFDSSSPEFSPVGRSATRRSQAKIIPTPETPQMLISKPDTIIEISSSPVAEQANENTEQPSQTDQTKEKVLKMKEIYSLTPSRGSPASDTSSNGKKPKDGETVKVDEGSKNEVVEVTSKSETNYSKSRVKVSPYRRSTRISEQFSTIANYSGNNSTQETDVVGDITSGTDNTPADGGEGSSTLNCSRESTPEDVVKSYTESVRSIKGRKSYRQLRELSLRNLTVLRQRTNKLDPEMSGGQVSTISSANATIGSETRDTMLSESSPKWTPVGHVVGRKRRQSPSLDIQSTTSIESPALIHSEDTSDVLSYDPPSKRQRLVETFSTPLRYLRDRMTSSTPIVPKDIQSHTKLPCQNTGEGTSTSDVEMENQNQIPITSGPTLGRGEEHKWCSVM